MLARQQNWSEARRPKHLLSNVSANILRKLLETGISPCQSSPGQTPRNQEISVRSVICIGDVALGRVVFPSPGEQMVISLSKILFRPVPDTLECFTILICFRENKPIT